MLEKPSLPWGDYSNSIVLLSMTSTLTMGRGSKVPSLWFLLRWHPQALLQSSSNYQNRNLMKHSQKIHFQTLFKSSSAQGIISRTVSGQDHTSSKDLQIRARQLNLLETFIAQPAEGHDHNSFQQKISTYCDGNKEKQEST